MKTVGDIVSYLENHQSSDLRLTYDDCLDDPAADRALSLGLEQVLREGDFAQKRYEKFRGMGAPRSRREAP